VDECFAAAKSAWRDWARTPLWRRAVVLRAAAQQLRDHAEFLAGFLVQEVAKPAKDARSEILRSADLIDYTAEEGVRLLAQGQLLASDAFQGADRTKLCLASPVPLGVVLCIPPFNYPVNLACSKIAPALIAGNAVVLKPPSQGALSGVLMARCFQLAGLPDGLLNVVTGRGREIGDYLVEHPGVNCISFTGGNTGLAIARRAAMVPLQMELGGKDACVVCADADLDLAASAVVKGGFSYSGQRCTAVKVVLVEEPVADALVAKVCEQIAQLTVGMPEDNASIVPVVDAKSADFIEGLVRDAEGKGAQLLQEWRREDNLIWPLLLDRVTKDMRLAWEEPFGPVVPVIRIQAAEEGVAHCNESRFGLQGCVFTRDINRALALSSAMETGTVQINAAPARGPDHFPFQGMRDSGIGSQGVTNSIKMMFKTKTTVLNLPQPNYTLG
jgi:glyceraldehyde-3-phosphate dehydrogenase (NADP+)